ncbi:MAG: fumarylacetoacetate hydrolase family protein [Phycisphaerae bacterium]
MRICRFESADGRVYAGRMVDDRSAHPLEGDLFGDHRFADRALAITRLLAPITPPNIFAIGRNYRAHAEELGNVAPEQPLIFMKPTTSVIGPDEPIVLPASAPGEVDYEAELAIVIGRTARRVGEADARTYVFGYTCANDVSARDCQRNDKQWARAKGFDTFCPLGPWIVTERAFTTGARNDTGTMPEHDPRFNPDQCVVLSRLNGQVMQNSNTGFMIHSCAKLVSYLSHQFTLLPGTLILTGTPEGVGMGRKPPVFLKSGDTIEVEIAGIGTIRNRAITVE